MLTELYNESNNNSHTLFNKTNQKNNAMYPPELVNPMRKELANAGFKETQTATDVEQAIKHQPGTTLLVVNSVCGCAAGTCRPGVLQSLKSEIKPDQLITVFAGVDREATQKAREFLLPYPPSSPAIALFKDGQLVHMIERHHIEGRSADMIGNHLKQVYQEYCTEKVN